MGGKSNPPAAPNYTAAAEATAAANNAQTDKQTWANRPTINTPWGTSSWSAVAGTDPATGLPINNWTNTINLSPEQQAALGSQQAITAGRSSAALGLLGQATDAFSRPIDYAGAPQLFGYGGPAQLNISGGPRSANLRTNPFDPMSRASISTPQSFGQTGSFLPNPQNVTAGAPQPNTNTGGGSSTSPPNTGTGGGGGNFSNAGNGNGMLFNPYYGWVNGQPPPPNNPPPSTTTGGANGGGGSPSGSGGGMLFNPYDGFNWTTMGYPDAMPSSYVTDPAGTRGGANASMYPGGPPVPNRTPSSGMDFFSDNATNAIRERMQPMMDRRRSQLENQLLNQGMTRGSEAWNNAMGDLGQQENDANLAAVQAGINQGNVAFGQGMQLGQFSNAASQSEFDNAMKAYLNGNSAALSQQQASTNFGQYQQALRAQWLQEQAARRGNSLNEVNALLSGQQVNQPSFGGPNATANQGQGANYLGAAQMQYGAGLDAFNIGQAQNQGWMNGLGSAAQLFAYSDANLKENIKEIGALKDGTPLFSWNWKADKTPGMGVIAQEIESHSPELVAHDRAGNKMVDYAGLLRKQVH